MAVSRDERDRILAMIESGQVTAEQAGSLLDALESEREFAGEQRTRGRDRTVRLRVSTLSPRSKNTNVIAALPVSLIRASLRLGAKLVPQLGNSAYEDMLRAIENGATGRLLDLQDLEKGERLEIFVE